MSDYIFLDSRYAVEVSPSYKWVSLSGAQINKGADAQHSWKASKKIRAIRLHSFVIRRNNQIQASQRVSILIEELAAQSFIMGNRRFHFLGVINDLQSPISVGARNALIIGGNSVPDFTIYDKYEVLLGYKMNEGWFYFNQPITRLDSITVSLADPFTKFSPPKYEIKNVSVQVLGGFAFKLRLIFDEPHTQEALPLMYQVNPAPQYSIFIDNFTTDNPADAEIIAFINSYEFNYAEIIDAYTIDVIINQFLQVGYANPVLALFGVPPSFSPFGIVGSPGRCSVRFNSYRVFMTLEVKYE